MLRFLLNAEAGGSGAVNSASTLSDQGIGQSLSTSKHCNVSLSYDRSAHVYMLLSVLLCYALSCFDTSTIVPTQVLVLGILVGFITVYADLGPDVGKSLSVVSFIRPDIIFYALLPVPIFNTALHTDVNMFMREAWHVLALAVIGLAVAATLTAVFAKYILPYGWSWTTALYFGAMCSANDPQAVIEKLKEGGVTSRLSVLIEGEGLLKDGTAIVLFSILFNASAGINDAGMDTLVTEVLRLTFGGMLLGLIIGAISASAVGYILEDPVAELTVTVVACFTAFLIGDATPLHVSGVVALITCGLYMSFYGRPRVSSSVQQPLTDFWGVLTYLANTLIFFIAGLVAVQQAYGTENRGVIPASDYGYLVALYLW
eukprot:10743-Heterococcus_DN1.PRE.1